MIKTTKVDSIENDNDIVGDMLLLNPDMATNPNDNDCKIIIEDLVKLNQRHLVEQKSSDLDINCQRTDRIET